MEFPELQPAQLGLNEIMLSEPLAVNESGPVGEPVMLVPETDCPVNVCEKLAPVALISVEVEAPDKSILTIAAWDCVETSSADNKNRVFFITFSFIEKCSPAIFL